MTNQPCLDDPGPWGAGRPRDADPRYAVQKCREDCDLIVECLEHFAANNRPEHVPFLMTTAGLHGEQLRRAMRLVREGKAA